MLYNYIQLKRTEKDMSKICKQCENCTNYFSLSCAQEVEMSELNAEKCGVQGNYCVLIKEGE